MSDRNEFENFETKTLKYKVDWECKEKNIQKPNPVEVLLMSLDLLKDLELYPDVKCDVVEVLDSLRTYYSENLTNSFKSFVSKKTVL